MRRVPPRCRPPTGWSCRSPARRTARAREDDGGSQRGMPGPSRARRHVQRPRRHRRSTLLVMSGPTHPSASSAGEGTVTTLLQDDMTCRDSTLMAAFVGTSERYQPQSWGSSCAVPTGYTRSRPGRSMRRPDQRPSGRRPLAGTCWLGPPARTAPGIGRGVRSTTAATCPSSRSCAAVAEPPIPQDWRESGWRRGELVVSARTDRGVAEAGSARVVPA